MSQPGDGSSCGDCPAPGECRNSVCLQPSASGEFCEFDSECEETELCIAGRCTPDPRYSQPCTETADCAGTMTCAPAGICVCAVNTDCPSGLLCEAGACVPPNVPGACLADEECEGGFVCDANACRPDAVCMISHPNLAGTWNMSSILRIREALPGWLDSFLEAVEEPFRFLAGDATCIDFGLPSWVEQEICDLVRPFVDEHLPPWAAPLFRAIANLNDVLSEWHIEERMELTAGVATDSYRGTHEWQSIQMFHRGQPLVGDPGTILDWQFEPSPFNASAVCGTFHIERHDVNVSIGAIIAWAVDLLVYEASDHQFDSAADALGSLAGGFCDALADAVAQADIYSGAPGAVRGLCQSGLQTLIDEAIDRLVNARLGLDLITLRGQSPVAGPNALRPGTWDGTLVGRDFSGEFDASR